MEILRAGRPVELMRIQLAPSLQPVVPARPVGEVTGESRVQLAWPEA